MVYDEDFDPENIDYLRDVTHDESVYARKNGSTSIPFEIRACEKVAALLRELGEIAMHAPGGHQHVIDEASHWASALTATTPR